MIFLFSAFAAPLSAPVPRHDLLVQWSAEGDHLQVGNRVHHISAGSTRTLPGTWRYSHLSPNGALSARVDETTLTVVGDKRLPFSVQVGDAVASWLSNTSLLLIQRQPDGEFTCATVTVDKPTITTVPCPTSDYHQLYHVVPGPNAQLAVQSAGEGHPGVNFVTWTPERQSNLALPAADLYPSGPLTPSFAHDRVFAHTSCDLRKERGCTMDDAPPAYVFSAVPGDTTWTLVHEDLPFGLDYDAVNDRFAWAEKTKWCISDLKSAPTCQPLETP